MNKSSYHFSADVIRSLAILGVITIHIFSTHVNSAKDFLTGTWWFANFVDSTSRISVPLFIMLSGFLLLHHEKNYGTKEFLKKRFMKIGIALVLWPLIYYVWQFSNQDAPFVFKTFLKDVITINIYYHLYYLYVIAGLYLLTPPLKVFLLHSKRKMQQYLLSLVFLFAIATSLSNSFLQIGFNVATIFSIFIPYLGFYLAGDYLRNIVIEKKQLRILSGIYVALIILTAVGNKWFMEYVHWSNHVNPQNAIYDRYFYEYTSITVIAMSLILFVALLNLPRLFPRLEQSFLKKIIIHISGASFGMYLIHPLLLAVSEKYFPLSLLHLPVPFWLFLVIKTLLLFLFSYLLVKIIKKIPLLTYLT